MERTPIPPHCQSLSHWTGPGLSGQAPENAQGVVGWGGWGEGAPFPPHPFSILLHSRALLAGCSGPEDRAGPRRHIDTQTEESHAPRGHSRLCAPGTKRADQRPPRTQAPRPSRPLESTHTHPHTHTHTHTHTHARTLPLTRAAALKLADLTLSPEPLTWASTSAPRAEQPPAQGRAAGGGGGRSPGESGQAATNPGGERGGTHVRVGTAGWRASQDIPSHTRGRLGT